MEGPRAPVEDRGVEVLRADDGSPSFGVAVAAGGEWIAVGDDGAVDGAALPGRVEIFRRDRSGRWRPHQTLCGDRPTADRFGASLSMDRDRLIVGAPGPDGVGGGFAEVFRLLGDHWISEGVLSDPAGDPRDRYGAAVAIDTDLAVVGVPRRSDRGADSGAAAVHVRSSDGWGPAVWLTAPDAAAGDRFGSAVATDGRRVIVGVVGDDDLGEKSGSAWIFGDDGDGWQAESKLRPTRGGEREWFGHAVAIEGDQALVGAPRANLQGSSSGVVWAFVRAEGGWSATSAVPAPGGRAGDWYGIALAMDGAGAIAGRPGRDLLVGATMVEDAGGAVGLRRHGRRWSDAEAFGEDLEMSVRLRGSAVAISSEVFVVGHLAVEDGPTVPGEVLVFPRR